MYSEKERRNNLRDFNEKDEQDPIRMFSWFNGEVLDKKVYWFFLFILALLFTLSNIGSLR